jgi:choline kinase
MMDLDDRKATKNLNENLSCYNVFIIASGFESSLSPLCENSPKSLIKVANKPLLAYQLEYFERNKFKEVTVIVNKKFYQVIDEYINDTFQGNIKVEIISTSKESLGSLDIFSLIKNKITKKNFILLSGDTILSLNLFNFLDKHLLNNSLVSLVLAKDDQKFLNERLKYLSSDLEISLFGISKSSSEGDSNSYQRLCFHRLKIEGEDEDEKVYLYRHNIMKHTENFDLVYNFEDIHFYVFNRNIYKLFEQEKIQELRSIKNDLIPYLINNYHKKWIKDLFIQEEGGFNFNKQPEIGVWATVLDGVKDYA